MKKHIILAAVAALATFTACSNEDEEEPQVPGAEVYFTINNTVTRAVTDANGLTTFKDNDLVYIYSKGLYAQEMNGVEFKVSGTNLTPTSSDVTYRYNGTKGATFTAYHYNNGVITNPITVGNDQSNTGS
ncbi:MAG: fimbrillin family protein, partial [Bacteroides sp.]